MDFKQIKKQLIVEIKQDRKKAGILISLFVVALFIGVKMFVNSSSPSPAGAATGCDVFETNLKGDSASNNDKYKFSLNLENNKILATPKLSCEDNEGKEVSRNLFWINPKFFKIIKETNNTELVDAESCKEAKFKALQEKIQKEAQGLILEGMILGDNPAAIINGKLVNISSKIQGFEIIKIVGQSCDIRKGSVILRIKMGASK